MPKDNVSKLIQPGFFDDQLTEVLRNGPVPCLPGRCRLPDSRRHQLWAIARSALPSCWQETFKGQSINWRSFRPPPNRDADSNEKRLHQNSF